MKLLPKKWTKKEAGEKILEIINSHWNEYNKNFNIQTIKKLIFECDLNLVTKEGNSLLIYILLYNKVKKLNFTKNEIFELLDKGNLNQVNNQKRSLFFFLFSYNKNTNAPFNEKEIQYLFQKCSPLNQRITFRNLVEFNDQYSLVDNILIRVSYQKEIEFVLYNCNLQITKEIKNWLKDNNKLKIIEIIEKRDLFFQLNQDIKPIDKKEKISTIKI
jgi:hypothetical protein